MKIIIEHIIKFDNSGGWGDILLDIYKDQKLIQKQNNKIMDKLQELTQEVSETKSVMASAVTLIKGLKKRLDEAGTDPAKLDQLRADLDQGGNELAAAVAENTPAEGEPGTGDEGGISPNPGGDTGGGPTL